MRTKDLEKRKDKQTPRTHVSGKNPLTRTNLTEDNLPTGEEFSISDIEITDVRSLAHLDETVALGNEYHNITYLAPDRHLPCPSVETSVYDAERQTLMSHFAKRIRYNDDLCKEKTVQTPDKPSDNCKCNLSIKRASPTSIQGFGKRRLQQHETINVQNRFGITDPVYRRNILPTTNRQQRSTGPVKTIIHAPHEVPISYDSRIFECSGEVEYTPPRNTKVLMLAPDKPAKVQNGKAGCRKQEPHANSHGTIIPVLQNTSGTTGLLLKHPTHAAHLSSPSNSAIVTPSTFIPPASHDRSVAHEPSSSQTAAFIWQPTLICAADKALGPRGVTAFPLPGELLSSLAVVRVHRRPHFHCKESRELVEVRPLSMPAAPTMLAYRDRSGGIEVDWTAKSNHRAARTIAEMWAKDGAVPVSTSGLCLTVMGMAVNQYQKTTPTVSEQRQDTPTIDRENASKVYSLVADGVNYTISNQ